MRLIRQRLLPWTALLVAAAVLCGASPAARAQAQDDLPGRVGRIAEFAGQIHLSPEDRPNEWQQVGLNYPVASGDNLWVGGDGRAEVDYGGGQFRLAGDTNLHVSRLDENQIALFIAQGRVVLRVRVLDPGDSARIDAPNTQIQLTRPGLYRIDVTPDRQSTSVTVREGEAVVMLANGAQQVLPGQMATVTGSDPTGAQVYNGTGQDGFDAWSASRDRRYDRPRGNAHVSRQMVGYADLDEYGSWQTVPEYGQVWYPTTVAAGWAPYQDGYWTNVGGWGLTWVDAAPWGYAPFHYGRWAWVGGRWGWCPGTFVARPVWAPALVGWVGGAGWAVSANFGGPVYGWVPLGWGEPFNPWWRRCSNNCWAGFNRPYAVNVTVRPNNPPAHFRHATVPGAVSVVAGTTLSGRQPVRQNLVPVPTNQFAAAPVLATAPAVPAGPLRIPGTRPGTAGTPPPASTFYPVSRPGRMGADPAAKAPAAAPVPGVAPPSPVTVRPGGAVAPGASGDAGTPPSRARTAPPITPSPMQPGVGAAPGGTPLPQDSVARPRAQPPTVAPLPPTAMPPATNAPPATGAATPARGDTARGRPQQLPMGTPAPSVLPSQAQPLPATPAPVARPAQVRPPSSERIGPMPVAPAPAVAPQGTPATGRVATPAPVPQGAPPAGRAAAPGPNVAPQGVPQGAPQPAGRPHGERGEASNQGKPAPQKGDAAPAPPARP